MSSIGPLLEVQETDLAIDRLREKRTTLPERTAFAKNQADILTLERTQQVAEAQRDELARAERELGGEVASIVAKVKEVETSLYSGTVTIPKELDALHHALEAWKQKQDEAEERELELLEQMESADSALDQQQTRHNEMATTAEQLLATIAAAESSIDEEIVGLERTAAQLRTELPEPILVTYDRLRDNPRLVGRAAVALGAGLCEGCRLDLPVLEYRRLRDEPEDAIISCVHCSRLLVR